MTSSPATPSPGRRPIAAPFRSGRLGHRRRRRPPAPLLRFASAVSGWPRRAAALACLLLAVVSALADRSHSAGRAAATPSRPMVVAARDLAAGRLINRSDLTTVDAPLRLLPAGAFPGTDELLGRRIGAPMARGEPLTRLRLLDTAVSSALLPDQVAMTVTLTSRSEGSILAAGATVDLLRTGQADPLGSPDLAAPSAGSSRVATGVRILAVAGAKTSASANSDDSQTIVIAADRLTATRIAAVADGALIATLRPPS